MQAHDVLKQPLISEKNTTLQTKVNQYCFLVDKRANKLEIKTAVEKMYGVSVADVSTAILPGKRRARNSRKGGLAIGQTQSFKKAYVTLGKGEAIDFYANV